MTTLPAPPALHLNPWHTHRARITEVIPEVPGIATYRFVLEPAADAEAYRFAPGQFNMIYVPGVGDSAISHCGNPSENGVVWHTIREAGNVTKTLARMPVGSCVGLRGPFGTSWPVAELRGKDVVIVAGGLGLPPLRPLLYTLLQRRAEFGQIWLICGARSPAGLLYPSEYAAWSQQLSLILTVDRPADNWQGLIGVVTVPLERLALPRPAETCVVTCGPDVMMHYVAQSALGKGIPAEQIWVSLERNMQCAAGLCGHCQMGPEFVCKDGPVFRFDKARPWMSVEAL